MNLKAMGNAFKAALGFWLIGLTGTLVWYWADYDHLTSLVTRHRGHSVIEWLIFGTWNFDPLVWLLWAISGFLFGCLWYND